MEMILVRKTYARRWSFEVSLNNARSEVFREFVHTYSRVCLLNTFNGIREGIPLINYTVLTVLILLVIMLCRMHVQMFSVTHDYSKCQTFNN